MGIFNLVEQRFKEEAKRWLNNNFEKHKNYLEGIVLSSVSAYYDEDAFQQVLALFSQDPDGSVNRLYDVLSEALKQKFLQEAEKGKRILKTYQSGDLSIEETGQGQIQVGSETKQDKSYDVSLIQFTCQCQQYQRLKYAGLFCKHVLAAYEVFKDKYPVPVIAQKQAKKFRIEKSELTCDVDTSEYFVYGSQRLKRRKQSGNPLIPSGIFHILEGGEPEVIIHALSNNETLLLIGDSGVGKSRLIQYLAQETYTPLMCPSGHQDVTVESLLGCMTAVNGSTVWRDGIIPEAMIKGYWLLLEEINAVDPGVLKVLNELLDLRQITITIAGGPRVVKANPHFRLICTSNPPDNPIYKGIELMSFELMDRFDTVVYLDYLSAEAEARLIREQTGYTDGAAINKMVEFANKVREGMRRGEIFATVTTRGLLSWGRKAGAFGPRVACEVAILRKMDSHSRLKALDLFNAYFK